MANVDVQQLLGSATITRVISRIKTPQSRFQDFWGMGIGGSAVDSQPGKVFVWDIFDKHRQIATGRPAGVGPATIHPRPIGQQTAAAYRSHEKLLLLDERLYRTRPLGANYGQVDTRGQAYVTSQQVQMAQRFKNSREFLVSRMMRGGFDLLLSGDDMIPVDSGNGTLSINFQIPAGNKSQLNMLGAGDIINVSWATTNTADIVSDALAINAAFEQLHGMPLRHVWMNSNGILNVLNNDGLQSLGGTANRVFETFAPTGLVGPDGVPDTGFRVVFAGIPWLTFHVYDGGLDVNGTYTKFIPDTAAIFTPDPSPTIAVWTEGSELIRENVMDEGREQFGFYAWTTPVIDPSGFEMKAIDIGLPTLFLPKAIAYGTVVF